MVIKADGKRNGQGVTVQCVGEGDRFSYLFNGVEDIDLESDLLFLVGLNHPAGGTYYPETTALKIVTALRGWFFDTPVDVDVMPQDDLEEIPGDDGVVY